MSSQSAATAAEGRPRRPRLSRRQREYGFDVSDQKFSDPRYWMGDDIASFLLLEELNPGDPGELSGAKLVLCGDLGEEDSAVLAEVADHHRIGFLPGVTAKELAQLTLQGIHDPDTVLEAKLGDAEDMSCVRFKGCVLHFEGGPSPRVRFDRVFKPGAEEDRRDVGRGGEPAQRGVYLERAAAAGGRGPPGRGRQAVRILAALLVSGALLWVFGWFIDTQVPR
ncbi:MAG: hypothetical protein ABSH46_08890 [Bryobacteraceae bacterium]